MILADVAQHNAKVIFAGSDIIFFLRFKYIYALLYAAIIDST